MFLEDRWIRVPAQLLLLDGTTDGKVSVADTRFFKIRQQIFLQSNTQAPALFQVNRVIDANQLELGPVSPDLYLRADVAAFLVADSAYIWANEQVKAKKLAEDAVRESYEHEPTLAIRTTDVDQLGNHYNAENPKPALTTFTRNGDPQPVVEDSSDPSNNRPLPVKLTGVTGDVLIEAENLNLAVQLDGTYNVTENPKPDSVGVVKQTRSGAGANSNQIQRVTAKRGSVDTDTVSGDTAIHDHDGNRFSSLNPLPVAADYSKILDVIGRSRWMNQAVYDSVIMTAVDRTFMQFDFSEDGHVIGSAVVTFTSDLDWSFQLNRFLSEDDGSKLLDDDDTELFLE